MTKISIEQFSALVEALYDAALDASRWKPALQEMSKAFGATFGGLGWENTRIMTVGGSHGTQTLEGEEAKRYRETFKRTLVYSNPMRVPVLLTVEVGDVYTPGMLVPEDEYKASRYYLEYVKPMGWGDGLSTVLSKEDGVVHFIAFARKADDPPFDADDLAGLKLLSPHIRRAYLIGNLIGKQKAQVAALAETFDGLSAAVFLIGSAMRVVYLNQSARALLALGEPLTVVREALAALDPQTQLAFDSAFDAAARQDVSAGRDGGSVILRTSGAASYVAHFMPLLAAERSRTSSEAVAAVFVSKAGLEPRSPIEIISRAYGLTPREMSVLVAVVEIGGVPEIAAQLGLTVNTVKSHLKVIFEKTGVGRQADLVKLVAGYVSPVVKPLDKTQN